MAIYAERDIEISDDGDLSIGTNGDINIAESTDSSIQLLKMIIATDMGEIDTSRNFGANLGTLIGRNMSEVIDRVAVMIFDGIRRNRYIDPGDVKIDVYPIDFDKIMLFVDLMGVYINSQGQEINNPSGSIKFYFPYTKERIMEYSDD